MAFVAAPFDPNIYGSSLLARARWVLAGGYVEPDKALGAFDRIARRDALGTRVHAALAIGTVAALMGPTSVAELALGPILVFFFVRTFNTFGTWVHWFGQPLFLLALAWAAWQGATLLWSDNRVQGLDEIGRTRWALVGVLLWPVIHARRRIVLGLAVGVALGQTAQVLQFVEQRVGAADPWFVRDPRRVSGWWDPVVAGSVLTGAVGLHLAPALFGRGRVRVVACVGLAAALAGVVATGTRGAWIASGALVGVTVLVAIGSRRPRPRTLAIGAVSAVLAGAALWAILGPSIASRVADGRREVTGALRGDYTTDTGRRVLMARRATEAPRRSWERRPRRRRCPSRPASSRRPRSRAAGSPWQRCCG